MVVPFAERSFCIVFWFDVCASDFLLLVESSAISLMDIFVFTQVRVCIGLCLLEAHLRL